MLTETMIHRQEDHRYHTYTTTSPSLLFLSNLDQQHKMQNLNRAPNSQHELRLKYSVFNTFRKAGDMSNAGHSAPAL
jgi:hypothetical protein